MLFRSRAAGGPRRFERPAREEAGPDGQAREHGRPGRGERRSRRPAEGEETWSDSRPVLRAARTRRDGLVTGRGGDGRKRGGAREGAGAGPGTARAGGGRGRSGGGREEYDADAVRKASRPSGSYNPFASFFKGKKPDEPEPPPANEVAPSPPAAA